MTNGIIILGIAIIMLPSILLILMPLIDKILTPEIIESINDVIDYIEYFIGSTNTTLLFGVITIIIVLPLIRWFTSFFTGNKDD